MQFVVHHDTGGSNSYQICKDGRAGYGNSLCNILLPKQGTPWQFGPIDAVTYHAGSSADYDRDGDRDDYNPVGPGIEVERFHDDPLTADQVLWLGRIGVWLAAEWGLPNVQYRGPQYGADDFRGHVNHSDLHPNPDGLTPAEWDAITAGDIVTPEQMDTLGAWMKQQREVEEKTIGQWLKDVEGRLKAHIDTKVTTPGAPAAVDYDKLASAVADKLAARLKD